MLVDHIFHCAKCEWQNLVMRGPQEGLTFLAYFRSFFTNYFWPKPPTEASSSISNSNKTSTGDEKRILDDGRSKTSPDAGSRILNASPPSSASPAPLSSLIPTMNPSPESQQHQQQQEQPTLRPQPPIPRNVMIFFAGTSFTILSLLITRRAFARRRIATPPAFSSNSPHTPPTTAQTQTASGPIEAVEALSLATVNVLSVGMMASGGALWYLGINDMADARRMLRGGMGVDGTGRDEKDAEEEFEEWMATVLSRKEVKAKQGGSGRARGMRVEIDADGDVNLGEREDRWSGRRVNERGRER